MKKLLSIKNLIGLFCIVTALVLIYKPSFPVIDNDLSILNIEKPTQSIIEVISPVSSIITDPTDRAKLAIFNQEFATRLTKYNSDLQQLNDLYALAAAYFFENSLKDKYADLDKKIIKLISDVTTEENHKLTDDEKNKLSERFLGLSWVLIQK